MYILNIIGKSPLLTGPHNWYPIVKKVYSLTFLNLSISNEKFRVFWTSYEKLQIVYEISSISTRKSQNSKKTIFSITVENGVVSIQYIVVTLVNWSSPFSINVLRKDFFHKSTTKKDSQMLNKHLQNYFEFRNGLDHFWLYTNNIN